jgi:pescadillo protein
MAVARNKELRGPRNKQKKRVPTRALTFNASSKRKLSLLGKKLKKGRVGTASNYVTRNRALKQLQISLKDFRRLCILKGIYPRDPPKKFAGTAKTYYAAKDIAFLAHEPLLAKFREHKTFMKRVKRLIGRNELEQAKHAIEKFPKTFSLDHLVRERYPTFESALADLDDALALVHLFAWLPCSPGISNQDHSATCTRLVKEWSYLISKTQSLRKVFCSIKGMYFQAEFRGIPITWLVPHKFAPEIPKGQVDFRIMKTFLQFYETLLGFVMFKLYAEDLGSIYPPRILTKEEENGEFLSSVVGITSSFTTNENNGAVTATTTITSDALLGPKSNTKVDEKLKRTMTKIAEQALKKQLQQQQQTGEINEDNEPPILSTEKQPTSSNNNEQDDFDQDETIQLLRENERQAEQLTSLFRNMVFHLSREVPLEVLELCIVSFGGIVLPASSSSSTSSSGNNGKIDHKVTHIITDRPGWKIDEYPGKEFIQPQWIFDCINAKMLLPVSQYLPEKPLPPHLSPFVDDDAVGYRPSRADEIERLRLARAGGGGTEALLEARGELPKSQQLQLQQQQITANDDMDDMEKEDSSSSDDENTSDDDDAQENNNNEDDEESDEDQPTTSNTFASNNKTNTKQQPSSNDFLQSNTFQGPMEGYFFRRGILGIGYYRDVGMVNKINPEKMIKSYAKEERNKEESQAKEMRTIMMSKKSKKLFDRMQHGIESKKQNVEILKEKRRKLQQQE